MCKGIIYRAYNKISKKSYIGQTTRNLEIRKYEHLKITIKEDFIFSRALRKYPEDSWEWSVLAEVELNKLNEYEEFFIKDLDTFKKGYNSCKGSWGNNKNNPAYNDTIYKLWHKDYGLVEDTVNELGKKYHKDLSLKMSELLNGSRNHVRGFVLYQNKDKYDEILNLYEFYHPDHGIIKDTPSGLYKKYRKYFKNPDELYNITKKSKPCISCKGWVLSKYKDSYNEVVKEDKSDIITLKHDLYGVVTNTRNYFKKNYDLSDSGISLLKNGKYKNSKGWEFVK